MYDTIHLWLPEEQAGTNSLLSYVPQFLSAITEHQKEGGGGFISGTLGSNYRANVSLNGLSLKGSLAKYYLSDNFQTLTRSDSKRAIQMLSDELHLPIYKAKVTRLDLAQNFLMKYKPEAYYNYLGESQHYQRLSQPKSLYYNNGLRTKLFYNKVAEGTKRGLTLPAVWQGQNVLRYEMRYTSRLAKEFNFPELTASILHDEKFYMQLVQRWVAEYEEIQKHHIINFNLQDMSSPKDFFKQLILMKINEIGQTNAMQLVEDLRARNAFDKPEYYSRLKKEIRELCQTPDLTTSSELVAELDKKVSAAKRYCR